MGTELEQYATEAEQYSTEAELGSTSNEERIRQRAYELYVERGHASGYEVEDWLQAERELSNLGRALRNQE